MIKIDLTIILNAMQDAWWSCNTREKEITFIFI